MHLIRHLPESSLRPSAVAIGNFDGLHRGHQAVIDVMQEAAREQRLVSSVLTFEPHPRRFFARTTPAFRIERLASKLARLRNVGVEQLFMPRFDTAFATMPAEQFLEQVLGRQLGAKAIVTGENFAFGHQRRGDSTMLKAWGAVNNIRIVTVPPIRIEGEICSSSAVRAAIAQGDMQQANQLLGRPYALSGRVVHGQKRGTSIGFPTANIALPPQLLLPIYGVYAVRTSLDSNSYDGVANLGIRPTMGSYKQPTLEVHLFETRRDIYGKTLHVSLLHFLRPEQKFGSVAELTDQIARDCEQAKTFLGSYHG